MIKEAIEKEVSELVEKAITMMDDFMRDRIDLDTYAKRLRSLEVDPLLEKYGEHFKVHPDLVYSLDALMMLSSLQHELDFQVAEYGANVASEDIRMLKDMLAKITC